MFTQIKIERYIAIYNQAKSIAGCFLKLGSAANQPAF
jgi:hypothetical protein